MRLVAAALAAVAWPTLAAGGPPPPTHGSSAWEVPAGSADAEFDGIVDLFDPDYLARPIDVARLPLRDAVTVVHGRGERVLYTFEDPGCGYCRALAQRLAAVGNVTVHTFIVALLGDASRAKADGAWCADDRAAAWQRTMAGAAAARSRGRCRAPLERTMKLAERLGVDVVPTMFFADGRRVVGLRTQEEIERRLRETTARGR